MVNRPDGVGKSWPAVSARLGHRAVAVLGEDLLGLVGVWTKSRKALASFGCLLLLVTAAGFSISRVSSGHDVVDVLAVLLGEDRLVLVGDQDVALAAGEGLQRRAAAVVLHRRRS